MTRGELREYFKDILNRTDCTDALADRFIEFGIRQLERSMRTPTMERTLDYEISETGEYLLPNTFLELIGLFVDGVRLRRVSGSDGGLYNTESEPSVFWREGGNLIIRGIPKAGSAVKLLFYNEFENLGTDEQETLELAIYPDAIVYSALTYAADFFLDERKPLFAATLTTIVNQIQGQVEKDEFAGRDLRIGNPYQGIDY